MHERPEEAAAAPPVAAAAAVLPRRLQEWAGALARLPQLLATMAFRRRSLQDELEEAALGGTLRRSLSALDLWCLGMGQAIASGIFNLTGGAALQAGSAILLSYLLAGATALCCAAVMAEFARELPISGAGFTWTITTLGELPAMFVLGNILAGQVTTNAAVSRAFSTFLAQLCGQPANFFNVGSSSVDPVAFGTNIAVTLLVATGVRESALFITGVVLVHLLMLAVVMIAGFTQADPANLQPFFSGGADNCIDAAGILFFTFIGMEAPAVGAEEARAPSQLPAAIVGNAMVALLVYFFMALSLLMMVPVTQVGTQAVLVSAAEYRANAFTAAFSAAGLGNWNKFVLVAAMLGALTNVVTLMYSCSRIVMVGARDRLLPPQLSRISKRTQTPAIAQLLVGAIISIISLLTSTASLQRFAVICFVVTYFVIANALLVRRYLPSQTRMRCSSFMTVEAGPTMKGGSGCLTWLTARLSMPRRRALFLLHLAALNALSIAAATVFQTVTFQPARASPSDTASPPFSSWLAVVVLLACWAGATLSLQLWVPLEYEPTWHIPCLLMPWVPSSCLLLVTLSLSSLPGGAWVRYAVWSGILAAFYLLYSLPASYLRHYAADWQNREELKRVVVELVFRDGAWVPARELQCTTSARSLVAASVSAADSSAPATPRTPRVPPPPVLRLQFSSLPSLALSSGTQPSLELAAPSGARAPRTPRTPGRAPSGMRSVSFNLSPSTRGSMESSEGSGSCSPRLGRVTEAPAEHD